MNDFIGYEWLAEHYNIEVVQPFKIRSSIGRSATKIEHGIAHQSYPASMRPENTFIAHLTFALKHEGVHLEFLARLFEILPVHELENWLEQEPTGQYARRAGFFYEWLTGRQLSFSGESRGNYVDAIDPDLYWSASTPSNNARWRVRDNLPGTREYCPMVMRTAAVQLAQKYPFEKKLKALEKEFGADLLMRSAVWLTIKESRASFEIEHEEKNIDRVKRFAAVMERRCGHYDNTLSVESLTELQGEILGERATRYGLRQSPVFVGESTITGQVVHYIGAHWNDVSSMLSGLSHVEERTRGESTLLRAAVLSFGFVYIHPMSDGNGRISRFLVNDILRRDGAVPEPLIIPISATITQSKIKRHSYDQMLETLSKPFMRKYEGHYRFGTEHTGGDGVRYDFEFDQYADANFVWRYLDLTDHVEYLAEIIDQTITEAMVSEANSLRSFRDAREGIKEWLEGSDADLDRIIRSIRENNGSISHKLEKEFPMLTDLILASKITSVIQAAFDKKT